MGKKKSSQISGEVVRHRVKSKFQTIQISILAMEKFKEQWNGGCTWGSLPQSSTKELDRLGYRRQGNHLISSAPPPRKRGCRRRRRPRRRQRPESGLEQPFTATAL
jgi:hypothetical protein